MTMCEEISLLGKFWTCTKVTVDTYVTMCERVPLLGAGKRTCTVRQEERRQPRHCSLHVCKLAAV